MADAVIIGETVIGLAEYRTWGRLRTVFGTPVEGTGAENTEYDIMYPGSNFGVRLKSAASGSGLIRADRMKVNTSSQLNFLVGSKNVRPSPPPTTYDRTLILDWWDYYSSPQSTLVPIEVQTQLTGQTVTTFLGITFTIGSTLFTTTGGIQTVLTDITYPTGAVVSVGKLTPIT